MALVPSAAEAEARVLQTARLDAAWPLIERFATLNRDAGSADELAAFNEIARHLADWGLPFDLFTPELLVSLPGAAGVEVAGRRLHAKTAAMARSTAAGGERAELVYEQVGFAADAAAVLAGVSVGDADVAGRFVLTEGLPMPGRIADLAARGARGVVLISPGERIHDGICTPIWGSPDLRSWPLKPTIPVVSVSNPDGRELVSLLEDDPGLELTIDAAHDEGFRPIPVLVAEVRGNVEPERFVLLHGHVDSWYVGISDNATGNACLLAVAQALSENRELLDRSVRIAWWSGHSQGRYAGSTWYADTFALDLERNCICHLNCDSPGCRDAEVYDEVVAMAEADALAHAAVRDFAGEPARTVRPMRAGDISFNNLGISTYLMLGPNITPERRAELGYYAVGGSGGNIEWHTEADTLELADPERLLRDVRLYAGAAVRTANAPVHPLDFCATVEEIEARLRELEPALAPYGSLGPALTAAAACAAALERLYAQAEDVSDAHDARPLNDALLAVGRRLVRILYAREGPYRQDPALNTPPLPALADAVAAIGSVPDGVLRTEVVRVRNRIVRALQDAEDAARRATSG